MRPSSVKQSYFQQILNFLWFSFTLQSLILKLEVIHHQGSDFICDCCFLQSSNISVTDVTDVPQLKSRGEEVI